MASVGSAPACPRHSFGRSVRWRLECLPQQNREFGASRAGTGRDGLLLHPDPKIKTFRWSATPRLSGF